MMRLIRKVLTDGYPFTDYFPVGIDVIQEKAFLQADNLSPLDVTHRQFTLAYNPVVIGLVMTRHEHEVVQQSKRVTLFFADEKTGDKCSALELHYYKISDGWDGQHSVLALLHVTRAHIYQFNALRRNLVLGLRYLINRKAGKYFGTLSFRLHKQYAAQFSFPRKVVLATVHDQEFHGLFPIDLHGFIPEENIYIWGIRHSNRAIPHLINSKQIVVADIPYTSYQSVYALGKFKSDKSDKPESNIVSKTLRYRLPNFILGYREITLLRYEDIGSQCLFFGKVIHEETLLTGKALHHVHILQFLKKIKDGSGYATNYK